jgi:hypothetical protein
MGRIILSFSAVFLFVAGGAALFAPQEIAGLAGVGAFGLPLAIQLIGSGLLGFAILDWMSRRNRIGGIYARPISMGNLLLFATAALTVGKAGAEAHLAFWLMVLCAIFAILAASFAWLIFVHDPLSEHSTTGIASTQTRH